MVVAVLYGVVPGIITVGGWFELFFVNTLGCPFNTGEIVYIICLVASVIWGIYETYNASEKNEKKQNIAFVLGFGMLGIPFFGYGWSAVITGIIILAILWFVLSYKRKKEVVTGVDQATGIEKKKMQLLPLISARIKNTALLCMLMLMIGYSSYALIVIRSSANPPMDQNSPEDIFTLGSYLSRDQYGDTPLLYGQAYTSQVALEADGNMCKPVTKEGAPVYQRKEKASADEKDSYFVVSHKNKYVYAQNMLFPRMHSSAHAQAYEDWMGGVEGNQVPYDRCGESIMVKVPTQMENIRFFLSYQCNFMYWRYFMWNFAGRQNDIQGNGEPQHRKLDYRFLIHRRRSLWRPEQNARRPEGKQGTQRVLLHAADSRSHRSFLAGLVHPQAQGHQERRGDRGDSPCRYPAVLGGILPVLHDRSCHRALSEPDSYAAT